MQRLHVRPALLCSAPPSLPSLPRSSQTHGGGRYSLIGAVVHSGSGANFGHYVAVANVCARPLLPSLPPAKCIQVPPIRGGAAQWVMFDDDYVSAFSQARLPGDFTRHI